MIQERPHAQRELQLRSESTPERGRPGDDSRTSRDRTPGSALQPEPQHQGQPYSSGHFPHSLYLPYGDGTDDPHQRFQPPYQQQHPQQSEWQHNRMMFQHQMQQQIIQNQMAQQQLGDFDQLGPYQSTGYGYGPQFDGPPQTQQQQQPRQQSQFQPQRWTQPQQWQQQQQRQEQQQYAQGAAPSTSEGPAHPPALSRRPPSGPPGGSGPKKQKHSFDFMAQPNAGLTYAQLADEDNEPVPTPEGESLSGARMFEFDDLETQEKLVWVGHWAKGAEAVEVKFALPGNTTHFRESDVQQSLHATMARKHLPESLIDPVLPNAQHTTGPWTQTMAAAAAAQLAEDCWLTVYSANEGTQSVEFEVIVLDPAGKSNNYTRRDGMTHAQILALRKEEDTRKIVLYVTWPSEYKTYPKPKFEKAKAATKGKVKALLADHAEHVSFGECKDNQGHLLPKFLVFIRHGKESSMHELAPALRNLRYIDVGLEELVKTSLNKKDLSQLGVKPCCYTPACVQGQPVAANAKKGRPARPAPKCDAGQRAYAARMCFFRPVYVSSDDRHADKRAGEERRASEAREAISKAHQPMQECRAHEAGRCSKGDMCYEAHNVPDCTIMCCSVRKPKLGRKAKFTTCTSLRVGRECPYSHEPMQELTEEEKAEAEQLMDLSDEAGEGAQIALAEAAEEQSAEATAAANAATAAAGAAAAAAAAAAAVAAEAVVTAAAATSAVVANPGEWTGGNGPYPGGAAPLLTPDQLATQQVAAQQLAAAQLTAAQRAAQQALLLSQAQANHSIQQYESAPQPEADA